MRSVSSIALCLTAQGDTGTGQSQVGSDLTGPIASALMPQAEGAPRSKAGETQAHRAQCCYVSKLHSLPFLSVLWACV